MFKTHSFSSRCPPASRCLAGGTWRSEHTTLAHRLSSLSLPSMSLIRCYRMCGWRPLLLARNYFSSAIINQYHSYIYCIDKISWVALAVTDSDTFPNIYLLLFLLIVLIIYCFWCLLQYSDKYLFYSFYNKFCIQRIDLCCRVYWTGNLSSWRFSTTIQPHEQSKHTWIKRNILDPQQHALFNHSLQYV